MWSAAIESVMVVAAVVVGLKFVQGKPDPARVRRSRRATEGSVVRQVLTDDQ